MPECHPRTLAEIARHIGAELHGDGGLLIEGVATLDCAQPGQLAFLVDRKYRRFLQVTGAAAVILRPVDLPSCRTAALVTHEPYLAYARAAALLYPAPEASGEVHASAVVAADAVIEPGAEVGPQCVIGEGARIQAHALVGPGSVVAAGAVVGAYSRLVARVTLGADVRIGRRCLIHPGAVIGADGFGLARDGERWVKIPQLGSVHIGDDVEVGANTTIDRGALKDTVIEDGVKLDNLVQVAHNVRIGAHSAVAGCAGIAGSTTIGRRCMIGGGAGIGGHITLADDVMVTGMSMVPSSLGAPGSYSSGWPARDSRLWRRTVAQVNLQARRRAEKSAAPEPGSAGDPLPQGE